MNHKNGELRALFEATIQDDDRARRDHNADLLMNEAVRDINFFIREGDYPALRDEATRIYNGHAHLRREEQKSMATGTEVKEVIAAARLIHLADEGPVSLDRAATERLELCARILCEFKGLDYDALAAVADSVPEHGGANPDEYRQELAQTRHKPPMPGAA